VTSNPGQLGHASTIALGVVEDQSEVAEAEAGRAFRAPAVVPLCSLLESHVGERVHERECVLATPSDVR
jgi:hypothetical protein